MLKAHFDAKEQTILANSGVAHNTGHTIHRGTPREVFIRDFLDDHLSEKVAIGTGEIIDSQSTPRQNRNQIDIVIYKRDYPKLAIGGGVHAYLAESVVATIEVKSLLTQAELTTSIQTAANLKGLNRSLTRAFSAGYQPPAILNYVVAYDGPASLGTVHGWIDPAHNQLGIPSPRLPIGRARFTTSAPSIDGVFVLGKGFATFDNAPTSFVTDQNRLAAPNANWVWTNSTGGNLLMLFLLLTGSVSGTSGSWLNPGPYISRNQIQGNLAH